MTTLRTHFQERADVYVAGDMFIYYEEGNPEAVVAPDVFVVLGTTKRDRSSYMLWQEPKGPDFVLEITSRSTRTRDQSPKRGTYAFLGVREYFQYDPTHYYLVPALQSARLVAGSYQAMLPTTLPDGTLVLHSDVLGLDLRLEDDTLRFYDPAIGQRLLSHAEIEQTRKETLMKIVRFSQNGYAPRLGCYLDQDQVMDLAASCTAFLAAQGVVRAAAIAAALFPQSTRGFLEGGSATQEMLAKMLEG